MATANSTGDLFGENVEGDMVHESETELQQLRRENGELCRELSRVKSNHSVAVGGLLRCQGLLSHFIRAEVRSAFLSGEIARVACPEVVLQSLDLIVELVFPRPAHEVRSGKLVDPAVDFVTKLLARDSSEPMCANGRRLPFRQSFADWRDFLNDLMNSRFWQNYSGVTSSYQAHTVVTPEPFEATTSSGHRDSTSRDSSSATGELIAALQALRFPKQVIPPEEFDPQKSYSLQKFLSNFERYFEAKFDGTEEEKSAHLGKFLLGTAKRAFQALGGSRIKYGELKEMLLTWYQTESVNALQRATNEFEQARLLSEDKLSIYCMRLEQLASRAFPNSVQERERQLCRKLRHTTSSAFVAQLDVAQNTVSFIGDSTASLTWNQMKRVAESHDRRIADALAESECTGDLSIYLSHYNVPLDRQEPSPWRESLASRRGQGRRSPQRQQFEGPVSRQVRDSYGPRNVRPMCGWCHKSGHTETDCWRKDGKCLRCGSTSHFYRECPRRRNQDLHSSRQQTSSANSQGRTEQLDSPGPSNSPALNL